MVKRIKRFPNIEENNSVNLTLLYLCDLATGRTFLSVWHLFRIWVEIRIDDPTAGYFRLSTHRVDYRFHFQTLYLLPVIFKLVGNFRIFFDLQTCK